MQSAILFRYWRTGLRRAGGPDEARLRFRKLQLSIVSILCSQCKLSPIAPYSHKQYMGNFAGWKLQQKSFFFLIYWEKCSVARTIEVFEILRLDLTCSRFIIICLALYRVSRHKFILSTNLMYWLEAVKGLTLSKHKFRRHSARRRHSCNSFTRPSWLSSLNTSCFGTSKLITPTLHEYTPLSSGRCKECRGFDHRRMLYFFPALRPLSCLG